MNKPPTPYDEDLGLFAHMEHYSKGLVQLSDIQGTKFYVGGGEHRFVLMSDDASFAIFLSPHLAWGLSQRLSEWCQCGSPLFPAERDEIEREILFRKFLPIS